MRTENSVNHNQYIGKIGEQKASVYLKNHGYEILERNYRIRGGEIDIIAKKEKTVVFAEVKTRTQEAYGAPAEAVNYYKRENIRKTAQYYIMEKNLDLPCRFDVLEVYAKKSVFGYTAKINHIENAF